MKTLHGFTEKVIAERKQELEEERGDQQVEEVVMVVLMLMPMLMLMLTMTMMLMPKVMMMMIWFELH